jgi:hypothetical protein
VRRVDRLGIYKEQPLTRRGPGELGAGEGFAMPARGQRAAAQQAHAGTAPREIGDDGGGLVFAVVVQHEDFAARIVLPRQRLDATGDRARLVARRDEDRDERTVGGRGKDRRPAQQAQVVDGVE